MKLKTVWSLLSCLVIGTASAQTITIEEYINTFKEIAIKEMIRTGVPASITLAQGIVETENGNSILVKKSNNHFGIKCKETWTGPSVSHDDDAPGECFRKYNNAEESYIDHSNFLVTRKHYSFLFTLNPADYKAWAYGLKKAGYATNPRYPEMLIKYIETYNLNEYSLIALGKKQAAETTVVVKNESVQPPIVQETKPVVEKPAVIKTKAEIENKPVVILKSSGENKPVAESKPVVSEPVAEIKTQSEPVVIKSTQAAYPQGEFKINETRVIYALKGTAFLAIAQQFNVPLKYIFDFNDLVEKEILENDQLIYLQRKRRVGASEFHVVAEGEKLYDIAQLQGIRLEALLQYNLLKPGQQPAAGEKLYLQAPAPTAPKISVYKTADADETSAVLQHASGTEIVVHIVQPKETLYSISKKYQVSEGDLQKWNKLLTIDLKEGMELIINK